MADVRAMLRAERAARAPPSSKRKHAPQAPVSAPASKKRKADDDDEEEEVRKRSRSQNLKEAENHLPAGFYDEGAEDKRATAPLDGFVPAEEEKELNADGKQSQQDSKVERKTNGTVKIGKDPATPQPIDEAEWAAFQEFANSVNHEKPSNSTISALGASATLESAPQTAGEAAAQAREDQSKQRSKRDEEIEDEKEEAADRLEEEFEVMESLEERLRRLKEKREGLRRASKSTAEGERPTIDPQPEPLKAVVEDEGSSDEEDVDEFDAWRFGTS